MQLICHEYTLLFERTESSAGSIWIAYANDVNGNFVKYGCVMVLVKCHFGQSPTYLLNIGREMSKSGGSLHIHHIIRRDDGNTQETEAIKLRKVTNTSTTILRKKSSFADIIEALVSYTGVFATSFSFKRGVRIVPRTINKKDGHLSKPELLTSTISGSSCCR